MAIQQWRPYLLGRKFTFMTDHKALKSLLHQRISTPDQQHWLAKLMGYEFDIKYQAGSQNRAGDALSPLEEAQQLNSISKPVWVEWDYLREAVEKDAALQRIKEKIKQSSPNPAHYALVNDTFLYKGGDWLLLVELLGYRILEEFHLTLVGGHAWELRTLKG